jgi:hypothetical protein
MQEENSTAGSSNEAPQLIRICWASAANGRWEAGNWLAKAAETSVSPDAVACLAVTVAASNICLLESKEANVSAGRQGKASAILKPGIDGS